LKQVAEWLVQNAESVNLVARLDADHFAVVLPKVMYEAERRANTRENDRGFYEA